LAFFVLNYCEFSVVLEIKYNSSPPLEGPRQINDTNYINRFRMAGEGLMSPPPPWRRPQNTAILNREHFDASIQHFDIPWMLSIRPKPWWWTPSKDYLYMDLDPHQLFMYPLLRNLHPIYLNRGTRANSKERVNLQRIM